MNDLTVKQKVIEFAALYHKDQLRKYTNEPYINHLVRVANKVENYGIDYYIIGMLHDILEDTECTPVILYDFLKSLTGVDSDFVLEGVIELTNVYTKENYPHLNRKQRKYKEHARLSWIGTYLKIKFADIIDNVSSIVENDKKFGKVYIKEKKEFLEMGHPHTLEFKACKKLIVHLIKTHNIYN